MPIYTLNSSGVRSRLIRSPARLTRSRAQVNDTHNQLSPQFSHNYSPPPSPSANRRPHGGGKTPGVGSDSSEDSDFEYEQEMNAAEASEEDDEDEDDDDTPAGFAPSHVQREHETGRFKIDLPELAPFDWDLGDDESYEEVNDISDDDEDEHAEYTERAVQDDLQAIYAQIQNGEQLDDINLEDFGLAAFSGFDFQWGGEFSSESESDYSSTSHNWPNSQQRFSHQHSVHFEDMNSPSHILSKDYSPQMQRTLLPPLMTDISSLPPPKLTNNSNAATDEVDDVTVKAGEGYDSDATVEDLPPQAYARPQFGAPRSSTQKGKQRAVTQLPRNKRKRGSDDSDGSTNPRPRRRRNLGRGPARGKFETNPAQPWSTIDASGKKLVIYPGAGSEPPEWMLKAMVSFERPASAGTSPGARADDQSDTESLHIPDDAEFGVGITAPDTEVFNFLEMDKIDVDSDLSTTDSPLIATTDDISHLTTSNVMSFRNGLHRRQSFPIFDLFQPSSRGIVTELATPVRTHRRYRSNNSPLSSPHCNNSSPVVRVLRRLPKRKLLITNEVDV